MTPISALAILFCIYAVSELIAQKTKAIFSTVLSIAILLLAGFWSGILPRTLIDDAQITGFGNIIAGLLIVSLGTTIDFAELRRQWKVVVTALCGVCGAVAAIVLIGRPFIGSEMAIAGAPIFAGGSAATLIMTSTLKEMNLTTAATFCIVLYVTQKFIGVPIASLLLRRTARLIRDDAVLVEQYSTLQEENAAAHHGPLHLPKCCERPSMYLAKLAVVAVISYYASKLTGGAVHYFVMCLIMGAVFFALGFLDKSILGKNASLQPDHVFRHHSDLFQSGADHAGAGAVRSACAADRSGLRRFRNHGGRAAVRQAAAHPDQPCGGLRHQLHVRFPDHHAHSAGGLRGVRTKREGKESDLEFPTAEDADGRLRHRYHCVRAHCRRGGENAVN